MAISNIRFEKHSSSRGEKPESRLSGKRVVIADDSARQRAALRALFESMGLVCVGEAANGLECLSVVKRSNPDLVSLDVLMPVMHGVEALGYLKDEGFGGLIIFVSELSKTEALSDIRAKGAQIDAVFSKLDSRESFQTILNDLFLSEEYRKMEADSTEKSA